MAHQHTVEISTPIPSIEEVGESLGLNKARQQSIIEIVQKPKAEVRLRVAAKRAGSFKKKPIGKSLNLRKKSKSAATRD